MSADDTPPFQFEISEAVRALAMTLPGAEEGSSCVNRAFRAGGKNFAFLGERDDGVGLRLKVRESLDELEQRADADAATYEVGTGGWVMLRFDGDDHPPVDDLLCWVTESYRLLVPKKLSRQLD